MCSLDGCEKPIHSKGFCQAHYRLFKKHGKPERLAPNEKKPPGRAPEPDRWRSRHNPNNPNRRKPTKGRPKQTHCKQGHEYAILGFTSKTGVQKCRECLRINTERYRDKVEPNRSRWLPKEVRDQKKTDEIARKEYRQTHCKRGHALTPDTVWTYGTTRSCKQCSRERMLSVNYGLTPAHVDEMLESQGNSCAICHTVFVKTPLVDHSHDTDAVRGLLCPSCNTLLGHARDDQQTLQSAIAYLQKGPFIFSEIQPTLGLL